MKEPNTDTKRKGISYTRVSTLKQVKGHSLQYQASDIEKYCQLNNIDLIKRFTDEGLSGYKFRPDFNKMQKYIKNNADNIDCVITYTITRYGRSTQDLLFQINKLKSMGIQFISVKEQLDPNTKNGRLLIGMLALIADFEAETIRERMAAGRAWAQEHGTKSGKPIGHPKADIDWDKVRELKSHGISWTKTASFVNVSTPTLLDRARKNGIYYETH